MIRIGTCSWNYDSWVGLVYSRKRSRAADYLEEYSKKYRTVEIDSWFYRMPKPEDVVDYLEKVDDDFRFTCKLPNSLSLTHLKKDGSKNQDFLSPAVFNEFLYTAAPIIPRLDAMMLEFEYLNRNKMSSLSVFLKELESFFKQVPEGLPLAIETRNKNYLQPEYFLLLKEYGVSHVFSEKLYMPPVYEVYSRFRNSLTERSVIRLLGGDRKEIEQITGGKWDKIVSPKSDSSEISAMVEDMIKGKMKVTLNINNHYEGSAPLTIDRVFSGFMN